MSLPKISTRRIGRPTGHLGFTLLEMVAALAVASVLLTSIASAIVLASRALPTSDGPAAAALRAGRVLEQFSTELQFARHIGDVDKHAITFTVPDRDGDGSPERLRYAWSGVAGDPLKRWYSDGPAVEVIEHVRKFTLSVEPPATRRQTYGASNGQTATRRYRTAVVVSLATKPAEGRSPRPLTTRVALLNTPEVLVGDWALDFAPSEAPTVVDVNADQMRDWSVPGGGSFDTTALTGGLWQAADGDELDAQPMSAAAGLTMMHVRFQSTSTPTAGRDGAVIRIHGSPTGSSVGSVSAALALQTDGTQTLTVRTLAADGSRKLLMRAPGLPAAMIDLRLLIDPAYPSSSGTIPTVNVRLDGEDRGTFQYVPAAPTSGTPFASIVASGGAAEFDALSIRVEGVN